MEYQKCSGSWSCSQRPSVTEKAHKATELQTSSWRPFSYEKSPCNCGCTYIVNGQRRVEITSGSHCTTLPLTWTIKVSVFYVFKSLSIIITRAKNCMKIYLCTSLCAEPCRSGTHIQRCKQNAAVPCRHPQIIRKNYDSHTIFLGSNYYPHSFQASGKLLVDFQLISSDFSCGNSLLNVRQKGVEKGEEMIFQTNDDLTNGSLKTVAAQIRIEFMAPRRSCRLNIQVNARSTSLSLKVIGNVQF